jgi:hypothetical protein
MEVTLLRFKMKYSRCKLLVLLFILTGTNPIRGQQPLRVGCKTCGIYLEKLAEIPSASNGVEISGTAVVGYSHGKYLLGPTKSGVLTTWTPTTGLVAFGSSGSALNQFPKANFAPLRVTPSGEVFALSSDRVTQIRPELDSITAQIQLPWRPSNYTYAGGKIAALSPISSSATAVPTITWFDKQGAAVKVTRLPGENAYNPYELVRWIEPAGDSAIWVAHYSEYILELINPSGVVRKTFVRAAPWFKPGAFSDREPFQAPPSPRISSIGVLPNGLLLVVALVPDANWHPTSELHTPLAIASIRLDPLFDTVLEFIDVASGSVVASQRFDEVLRHINGSDQVWTIRENSNGALFFEIYRPQIRR